MVKNTYTYTEFRKTFSDATTLKKKAELYPFLTLYEINKAGKIIKRNFNPSYQYMMNGKWYSVWGEFKITSSDIINRYVPAFAEAEGEYAGKKGIPRIAIVFSKTFKN